MQMPKLDKRQTIVAILLIIIVAILVWQINDVFFAKPTIAPVPKAAQNLPKKTQTNLTTPAPSPAANTNAANTSTLSAVGIDESASQKEYLQLLEQYKVAELQKMIAEDHQAIAAAQAATAESLSKIGQLGVNPNFNEFSINSKPITSVNNTDTSTNLTLVYTGLQDGQWTATLKRGNDTFDVMVGTVINNSKVTKIDNNEVVLQNQDHIIHIGFDGTTAILKANTLSASPTTATNAATPASTTPVTAAPQVAPSSPEKTVGAPTAQGIVQTPAMPVAKPNHTPASITTSPVVHTLAAAPIASTQIHQNVAAANPAVIAPQSTAPASSISTIATTPRVATSSSTIPTAPMIAASHTSVSKPENNPPLATPVVHKITAVTAEKLKHDTELAARHTEGLWDSTVNWFKSLMHPKPKPSPYFFDQAPQAATPTIPAATNVIAPAKVENFHTPAAVVTTPTMTPANSIQTINNALNQDVTKTETPAKTGFTIQLATLATPEALQQFREQIKKANLSDTTFVYNIIDKKHTHYGVILGHYATREAANKALANLPHSITQGGAYVKQLSDIHSDIHPS